MKIAAVQCGSIPGDVAENLRAHEGHIVAAKAQGAELVLFPELSAVGYVPNYRLWDALLENDVDIVAWMKDRSKSHGVYLGMGLAELIAGEIRNTYVITDPDGRFIGRAEKSHAESYVFKMGDGVHVLELGGIRIGVAICADNHFTDTLTAIRREKVSLLIMPHAWPTPYRTGGGVKEADLARQNAELARLPSTIARLLKLPVVFINQVGAMEPMVGLFGKFMKPDSFRLRGGTRIVDADGFTKAELGEDERVVCAELDFTASDGLGNDPIPDYDGWVHEGSRFVRRILAPLDVALGQWRYRKKLRIFLPTFMRRGVNERPSC